MAVLFSYGINAYSNYCIEPLNTELSNCTNNFDNSINPEMTSFDDDQIHQSIEKNTILIKVFQISVLKKYLIIPTPFFSIWQPPKLA